MTFQGEQENIAAQVCKTCGKEKPASAFYKQKTKRNGLFAECKLCQRQRNQKWIDENRDRFRNINRKATSAKRMRNPIKNMLALARARAKRTGLEFNITENDLTIPAVCPVLGIELSFGLGKGDGNGLAIRDTRASLDRVDNSKGYVVGNVVVVSYRANRIKSDANATELLKIARFYAGMVPSKGGQTALPAVQSHKEKQA